jgi:hypothetical protein
LKQPFRGFAYRIGGLQSPETQRQGAGEWWPGAGGKGKEGRKPNFPKGGELSYLISLKPEHFTFMVTEFYLDTVKD